MPRSGTPSPSVACQKVYTARERIRRIAGACCAGTTGLGDLTGEYSPHVWPPETLALALPAHAHSLNFRQKGRGRMARLWCWFANTDARHMRWHQEDGEHTCSSSSLCKSESDVGGAASPAAVIHCGLLPTRMVQHKLVLTEQARFPTRTNAN